MRTRFVIVWYPNLVEGWDHESLCADLEQWCHTHAAAYTWEDGGKVYIPWVAVDERAPHVTGVWATHPTGKVRVMGTPNQDALPPTIMGMLTSAVNAVCSGSALLLGVE